MSEDFDDWNPMSDDYQSIAFNSYSSGQTAAHLPHNLDPVFGSEVETRRPPKLYIEGFPSDLTETGLKNFLQRIGCKVLSVKILNSKKQHSIGQRFSFVEFESRKEAQKAVELITSQKLFKLSVRFASSESDRQIIGDIIKKEKQSFHQLISKQFEMKQKIDIGNRSAINSNGSADNSSMSPIQSDSGSHESSHLDLLSPLAKTDKLLKVLERPEDDCSFCSQKEPLQHLHFILSEQQVIDPSKIPELIDLVKTCDNCGRKAGDMKICSQCKSATYCDRNCQSNHWPQHRINCRQDSSAYISLNSTLNSSNLLNGNVSNAERTAEILQKVETKPKESSSTENGVKNNISEKITKTTPQIRKSIKESTPLVAEPQKDVQNSVNVIQREPEVTKPIESVPTQVMRNAVTKDIGKVTEKMTKMMVKPTLETTVDSEYLTDGEEGVNLCFGRNPFDFYLQKQSAEESMSIFADILFEKMDEFPQLSDEELKKGALCGGIYVMDGSCYRARIVDKINESTYALYFIDYGNTEPVAKKDIKRLPQLFFTCKAQAIHCSLTGLVPKNNVWSKDAIAMFGDVGESNEYSRVKLFEKTKDVFKIDLINKKGDSISHLFIEKGFANDSNQLPETEKTPVSTPTKTPVSTPTRTREKTPVSANSSIVNSPKVTFNKSSVNEVAVNYHSIPKPVFEKENRIESQVDLKSYIQTRDPNSTLGVMITNVYNSEKFQYFGTVFVLDVQELIEGLANDYPSNKSTVVPKVGDIVVVQGSDDECYRSYVLEVEPKSAKVFMFDSGFIEDVPKDKIFALEPKYENFPVFGVLLNPQNSNGARLIELSQTNESAIEGTLLRRKDEYVLQKDNILINLFDLKSMIYFIENNKSEAEIEEDISGGDPISQLPLRQFPLNKSIDGFALYQDSDDFRTFYVAGDAEDCSKLMNLCAQYSNKFNDNIRVNPLRGQVYLVRSAGDSEWYRALVYTVNGDKIAVKYIDFGNEEEIDIQYVMELSGEIKMSEIPPLAIKCKVESTKLSDDALKTKIEKATEGSFLLKMEVLRIEDGVHYVKVK